MAMETNKVIKQMKEGMQVAYLSGDVNVDSNLALQPDFVSNDYRQGKKVIVSIERELKKCDEFKMSVAFIKGSAINSLSMTLKELETKNIPGQILTTDYNLFTEPEALEVLAKLKNIQVRMYCCTKEMKNALAKVNKKIPFRENFHTKGYIFRKDEIYRVIIGSSNMTSSALTVNREWNTSFVATKEGQMTQKILGEFNELWNSENCLEYKEFIKTYKAVYEENKKRAEIIRNQQRIALQSDIVSLENYKLEPNKMQVGFIKNLETIVNEKKDKALLISATGTGKTYASAFAMRELGYKRVLFLAHRNQIIKQAANSYSKVFGNTVKTGIISGSLNKFELNADYIFASIQTMSKDENLKRIPKDYFDCIIYDEAHHSSADSYQKVMSYFTPRLSLGMTATPDKRDDNKADNNIYEIFEHNIVYEIRLQQAMEEDLLCPFHYFGIADIETVTDIDNSNTKKQGKVKSIDLQRFNDLTSDERVKHIFNTAEYYKYIGDRTKGLIFCSRIDEAEELSTKFNQIGWQTEVLSGSNTEAERNEVISRLVDDDIPEEKRLDYILSVDIFSEGADLPPINQVIMLRPTESPIVFIQQLGRGLRKYPDKEYVVILDFIGNYKNNFMIPVALSGDRSYNKDNARKYIKEGSRIIPGASTIHFDDISAKRIYESVDNANFQELKFLKENYHKLKDKLGRIPKIGDFDRFGEIDPIKFVEKTGSYYNFLVKYDKDYKVRFSSEEENLIKFVSQKFIDGKRASELILLRDMLENEKDILANMINDMEKEYNIQISQDQVDTVINEMTNQFLTGTNKGKYGKLELIQRAGEQRDSEMVERLKAYYLPYTYHLLEGDKNYYEVSAMFKTISKNPEVKEHLKELIDFGLNRFEERYNHKQYKGTDFVLYEKYTYDDVCRLLNWEQSEVALNIGGYKYNDKTKTFPVFINYNKEEDIADTIKYEDHFENRQILYAISKSGRTKDSDDVKKFLESKERNIEVSLFVRKNKEDKNTSKEFYYLGRMTPTGKAEEFIMDNTDKTAVEIQWKLDVPIREDLYEYITE
ncbi:PLD-like domain-containing protein [Lachnospiraceae bacterium C7]|nr:PLD-like domain-containing protein [Lachnospiraceae bacterium C7]